MNYELDTVYELTLAPEGIDKYSRAGGQYLVDVETGQHLEFSASSINKLLHAVSKGSVKATGGAFWGCFIKKKIGRFERWSVVTQ